MNVIRRKSRPDARSKMESLRHERVNGLNGSNVITFLFLASSGSPPTVQEIEKGDFKVPCTIEMDDDVDGGDDYDDCDLVRNNISYIERKRSSCQIERRETGFDDGICFSIVQNRSKDHTFVVV
ncbi:hypothetical protein Tco_0222759 [Tanacetum coccineum]